MPGPRISSVLCVLVVTQALASACSRAPAAREYELKGQVLTPMEVLQSATRVSAELLRLDERIGTVEPGKEADLIALAGNPLDDLRLFQDPVRLHLVMKGGAIYRHRL